MKRASDLKNDMHTVADGSNAVGMGKIPEKMTVGMLGAGAWGTAVAQCMALAGHTVLMWDKDLLAIGDLNKLHENRRHYPGMMLSENITGVADLADLAKNCDVLVAALPSDAHTAVASQLSDLVKPHQLLLMTSKGFRESDGALLSTVWQEACPQLTRLVVMNGPTFALEMMEKKLTTIILASENEYDRLVAAKLLDVPFFRCYFSDDVIGAQVGGAIKNILAVGAGMLDGLDLGYNARAALLTRGLAEMSRYCKALGGKQETIWGLAGMGDLLLTATSTLSRNYRFGQLVGRGVSITEAKLRVGTVEGVLAARIVTVQAQAHGLDLAIVSAIDGVLHGDVTPLAAVDYLMQRPQKMEFVD